MMNFECLNEREFGINMFTGSNSEVRRNRIYTSSDFMPNKLNPLSENCVIDDKWDSFVPAALAADR